MADMIEMLLTWRGAISTIGERAQNRIAATMATCIPLNARIWLRPAFAKACRVSLPIASLRPSRAVARNVLLSGLRELEYHAVPGAGILSERRLYVPVPGAGRV